MPLWFFETNFFYIKIKRAIHFAGQKVFDALRAKEQNVELWQLG
jgi:hypothetical protein